jgi:hypothetical protein
MKQLMTVDEFIEVYGDTEGLPHTKEEFNEWFKTNVKTREEQERAWKEFMITGQCHFEYPLTKDECFIKEGDEHKNNCT